MNVGRVVMFVIMGLALLVATVAENVIDVSVFMLGLSSAEITANWGQWWWWRFNGPARLAASFGGPVIFLFNKYVLFRYFLAGTGDVGYAVILASMGMTFVLWVLVALLTRPEPEERLVAFYKRARPMGFWGPIARKAGLEERSAALIPQGLFIALAGAMMVAAGTIAFSSAYVGRWRSVLIFGMITLGAGLMFLQTHRRYMKRVDADKESEDEAAGGRRELAAAAVGRGNSLED